MRNIPPMPRFGVCKVRSDAVGFAVQQSGWVIANIPKIYFGFSIHAAHTELAFCADLLDKNETISFLST
ncbi:hypothetical protein A9Q96_03010 [Rhodobacterales bacterium 52_120_T64]|nr:hypothetical protein A9Q96_03010 [Rhodobacterales bacterium 52_120_T64]